MAVFLKLGSANGCQGFRKTTMRVMEGKVLFGAPKFVCTN